MMHADPSDEIPLSRLIQDLEDGVITPENRERLMERLRHDPAARETYLEHIRLATQLRQTAETRAELGTMPVSMEMLTRAKRKSAITALVGGLAAVLVIALTLMAFQVRLTIRSGPPLITMDRSQDATYEIDWADGEARNYDELLPGDRVTLERGLLRFTFPSKVEAVIEGPTKLELLSASEIRLNGGIAWFHVPEAGRGFTVNTDRAKIIDLGTEFGVSFDHENTLHVHVAEGKVRVKPLTIGAVNVELTGGQAIRIDASGMTHDVEFELDQFRREFTHAIPYLHWSFDYLDNDFFPASGTMPDATNFRAQLRHTDGDLTEADSQRATVNGIRGNAFALPGDGLFAVSSFPGIPENAPRTMAAWIRYRGEIAPSARGDLDVDPRTGHGATTPFGNQGYLLDYTNSGLVTAQGAIGETLTAGTTYTLGFHVAALPEIGRADYHVELVAFDPDHDDAARADMRSSFRSGTVLAQAVGSVSTTDMSTRDEIVLTVSPGDANLGKELAIRIVKSGNSIIFDNIQLARKSQDGEALVLFEESFESPVVIGYAEQILPAQNWVGPVTEKRSDLGFGSARHGLFSQRPVFSAPYLAWDGGNGSRFAAFVLPMQSPRWSLVDATGFTDSPPSDPIIPGEWTHIATVHTGRITGDGHPEILHFINGNPVDVTRHPIHRQNPSSAPAPLHLGSLPGASPDTATLKGDIDELFIFRGALAQPEIQSLMNENRAVFPRKR